MIGPASSIAPTPQSDLDRKVRALRARADEFARLPAAAKARLLGALLPRVAAIAEDWVRAGCRAKGLDFGSPVASEEWLAGPIITARDVRLLHRTLDAIARSGRAPRPSVRRRPDGRIEVEVFPTDAMDKLLFAGFTAHCLMLPALDEQAVIERQAAPLRRAAAGGSVALVLGAGNVGSIPPTDTIYKMFVEGRVCLLKMNPVNEYLGPLLERAFAPLVERGYLSIAYGGGDAGAYLVEHPEVDDVHITGSDKTHDLIVWGPPGPERERRQRENDPLLKKSISSELGNVSPVAIVPADYADEQLRFMARNLASMVANNASFNCNAAKILVTSAGWAQAERFRDLLRRSLGAIPPRLAYYPGAEERYRRLTEGRAGVERFGRAEEGALPWAYVADLDPEDTTDPIWSTEPFCGILSETSLPEADPSAFLEAATKFMNERLWGTLNASILIHPALEADPGVARALDRAVSELRYGTVAINHWPALGYGLVSPPWGGHPSSTPRDIQSGIGWVHNTYLLDGIEKSVVRGPLVVRPTPLWFFDNRTAHQVSKKLLDFEASPSWLKIPALAMTAIRG